MFLSSLIFLLQTFFHDFDGFFGHTNEHNFPRSEEFNLFPLGGSFFTGMK
jgi:hypothetical protein